MAFGDFNFFNADFNLFNNQLPPLELDNLQAIPLVRDSVPAASSASMQSASTPILSPSQRAVTGGPSTIKAPLVIPMASPSTPKVGIVFTSATSSNSTPASR